jgi:hypothetical protein
MEKRIELYFNLFTNSKDTDIAKNILGNIKKDEKPCLSLFG